jgi:hypothetical protein
MTRLDDPAIVPAPIGAKTNATNKPQSPLPCLVARYHSVRG